MPYSSKRTKRTSKQATIFRIKQLKAVRKFFPRSLFLILGLVMMSISASYYLKPRQDYSSNFSQTVWSQSQLKPIALTIGTKVDAAVKEGWYVDDEWELRDDTLLHLNQSAFPTQPGNIIIYGHNSQSLFKQLPKVTLGEVVLVQLEDGRKLAYEIIKTIEVDKQYTQYLRKTNRETLTLYTCSGFLDRKRFIVQATPLQSTMSQTQTLEASL